MEISKELFVQTIDQRKTSLHVLKNNNQVEVAITNFGARIVALVVPDKNGNPVDVVTGFDNVMQYKTATEAYHGAIVGRFANRIARGRFSLNGKDYQLAINNPPNHLHGGPMGFHYQVWEVLESSAQHVKLRHLSADGEENYPGNLSLTVTYTLTARNELEIRYEAFTDADTVLNVTSHPFFNLNGQGKGTIERHVLQINASGYTPVDPSLIPTGIFPVANTPFDFTRPKTIGQNIDDDHEQIKFGGGYDHNYVLDGTGLRVVAQATGDLSGVKMEVLTDQPGMQLYTGNFMNSENQIKYGLTDAKRSAFCLETQQYPDAPNQPDFPTTILRKGEVFHSTTIYRFPSATG